MNRENRADLEPHTRYRTLHPAGSEQFVRHAPVKSPSMPSTSPSALRMDARFPLDKAVHPRMPLASACQTGGEDFRIRSEHSLLRKRIDDSLVVLEAERTALVRIMKQPCDRSGKRSTIVAFNNEIAVFLTDDALHVSDIHRCNGSARRHRLEERVWHLLRIGRQGEYIECAKYAFRRHLTGEDNAVSNAERARQLFEHAALAPVTGDQQSRGRRKVQSREN